MKKRQYMQPKIWIVSYLFDGKLKTDRLTSEESAIRWFDDLRSESKEDGRISEVSIKNPD